MPAPARSGEPRCDRCRGRGGLVARSHSGGPGHGQPEPLLRAKVVRYVVVVATVVVLGVVWHAFTGNVGVVLGFAAAGLAFAMQEVVGAVAGWFNILSGRIFPSVIGSRWACAGRRDRHHSLAHEDHGDRQRACRGELGAGPPVHRPHRRRLEQDDVTEPVFNYSASFDYLWEEIVIPVRYYADWEHAIEILDEEAIRISSTAAANDAFAPCAATTRYRRPSSSACVHHPDRQLPQAHGANRAPVRTARAVKDEFSRAVVLPVPGRRHRGVSATTDVLMSVHETRTDGAPADVAQDRGQNQFFDGIRKGPT